MSHVSRIIIADPHVLFRQSLKSLFTQAEERLKVFEATNGYEVIEIIKVNSIDLVIMEARMPMLDGFETMRLLRRNHPTVKVIIMTEFDEKAIIINILKHGISSLIIKPQSTSQEFMHAVECVLSGQKYFSEATIQIMHEADWMNPPQVEFSRRDIQILELLDQGLISKEIANTLQLSTNTVEFYRKQLLRKTQTKNSNELIRYIKNIGALS